MLERKDRRRERPLPGKRMEALARLPVFFSLDGKRAMVAGGSAAAAWKAELLSAAGAAVEVYARGSSRGNVAVAADPPRGEIVLHRARLDA